MPPTQTERHFSSPQLQFCFACLLQILRCFFAQHTENVRYSQLYINTVTDLLSLQSISHGVGNERTSSTFWRNTALWHWRARILVSERIGTVTGLSGLAQFSKGTGPRDSSVRSQQSSCIWPFRWNHQNGCIRFRGSTRTWRCSSLPLCLLPSSTKRRPCETGYCGRANLFCYPDPTAGAGWRWSFQATSWRRKASFSEKWVERT